MIGGMDHNLLVVHTGNTLLKSALLGYTREHEWFYSLHSLVSTLSTPAILDGDSTVSLMTISAPICFVSKEYLFDQYSSVLCLYCSMFLQNYANSTILVLMYPWMRCRVCQCGWWWWQ